MSKSDVPLSLCFGYLHTSIYYTIFFDFNHADDSWNAPRASRFLRVCTLAEHAVRQLQNLPLVPLENQVKSVH